MLNLWRVTKNAKMHSLYAAIKILLKSQSKQNEIEFEQKNHWVSQKKPQIVASVEVDSCSLYYLICHMHAALKGIYEIFMLNCFKLGLMKFTKTFGSKIAEVFNVLSFKSETVLIL